MIGYIVKKPIRVLAHSFILSKHAKDTIIDKEIVIPVSTCLYVEDVYEDGVFFRFSQGLQDLSCTLTTSFIQKALTEKSIIVI